MWAGCTSGTCAGVFGLGLYGLGRARHMPVKGSSYSRHAPSVTVCLNQSCSDANHTFSLGVFCVSFRTSNKMALKKKFTVLTLCLNGKVTVLFAT